MQPSNHPTIQPSNYSIKQRYPIVITFTITFTKTRLKIFYSLSFPLSLTHVATFSNHLIR
ncbi:hypothetical protein MMN17_05045 [Helicobacter pylori]